MTHVWTVVGFVRVDLLGELTEGVEASDELDPEVHPHVLSDRVDEGIAQLRNLGSQAKQAGRCRCLM